MSTAKKAPLVKATGPRAATGATTARLEAMRGEAFDMLLTGHKCPAIGAALSVSRQRAWQLAQEGLEQRRAETMDKAEQYRLMVTERHMKRLQKLDDIAFSLDEEGVPRYDAQAVTAAIAKATVIEAEIAKLWGAYAPTKSELTGANGGALQTQAVGTPPAHDLSNFSDAQLVQFEALIALATPAKPEP